MLTGLRAIQTARGRREGESESESLCGREGDSEEKSNLVASREVRLKECLGFTRAAATEVKST